MGKDKDRVVLFIFGMIILILGWMTTYCYASNQTQRCYEITPGVFKCYTTGAPDTIIKSNRIIETDWTICEHVKGDLWLCLTKEGKFIVGVTV